MNTAEKLQYAFFRDLKSYNSTNFRTLLTSDLNGDVTDSKIHKAFSSVVTRYFIFKEKHIDEYSESEFNLLYFQLKIDLVSRYFSEYPDTDASTLAYFQDKLRDFNDAGKNDVQR